MPELVPVRVRDCACPDAPHADGDFVYMVPMLGFKGGLEAERQMITLAPDEDAITAAWGETFVRYGAVGWNLLDADAQPVPFDVDVILRDYRLARPVAEQGMEVYAEAILAPFATKQASRSPTGPTAPTTSRRRSPTPS